MAIKEWSNANRYNSFNSLKGLTYYEQYKKIDGWLKGKNELPPPVECNLDPIAACNVRCYFCITQRYLRTMPEEVGDMKVLPIEYMYKLVDFLAKWGVRGLCISGGGEPTLHKGVVGLPQYARSKGMIPSLFTNGTNMNDGLAESMMSCQFISLSMNAVDKDTYIKIMGVDLFDKVDANMRYLAKKCGNSKTFICSRMLILPENYKDIYKLCKWSKEVGLGGFNVRPVDFERTDIVGHKKLELPIDEIQEQFERCHEEETDDFKVFTVVHKYDANFHVQHDFDECLAPPLLIPILQDGNAYLCVDKKMEANYRLGSCYPNPEKILEWWGSDIHRNKIKNLDINTCSRCTFGQYNIQIKKVVRDDAMMVSFP